MDHMEVWTATQSCWGPAARTSGQLSRTSSLVGMPLDLFRHMLLLSNTYPSSPFAYIYVVLLYVVDVEPSNMLEPLILYPYHTH